MFISFTHQAVKRGRRPQPPPPPWLDRSDGGVHEPAAQVCVFDPTEPAETNVTITLPGTICHPRPALVVTVDPLKCKVRLSARQTVFTQSPHLSVQQIKLASWPPEHTQHREGPRLRPGQIQFSFFSLLHQDCVVTFLP